jgi:hypothetical protein
MTEPPDSAGAVVVHVSVSNEAAGSQWRQWSSVLPESGRLECRWHLDRSHRDFLGCRCDSRHTNLGRKQRAPTEDGCPERAANRDGCVPAAV